MNNYQAAAAAAQGFGPPASPHQTQTRTGFPAANSPGPTIDMYSSSAADSVGYVQATSPQPSGFPAIAVSRAPLNYSPVSPLPPLHYIHFNRALKQ
jgi:RNA-binding protein Musashi